MGISYDVATVPFKAYAPRGFFQTLYVKADEAACKAEDDGEDKIFVNGWRYEEGDAVGGACGEGFYKGDHGVIVSEENGVINEGDFIAAETAEAIKEFAKDFGIRIGTIGSNVSFTQIQ